MRGPRRECGGHGMSALTVTGLRVSYGAVAVLHEVALDVRPGEIVSVIGGNGAGKTTLLKAIAGVLHPVSGRITGRPSWWVARHGIALVPEGRGVFGDQSVRDNLRLGTLARSSGRDAGTLRSDLDAALALFPALAEKLELPAASLSGGQQQMLAVARGLMARPRLMLLDEPSLGLAPMLVREIFVAIQRLREQGVTILLVEQMAAQALALADRAFVLERGRITLEGSAEAVRRDPAVIEAYLGRRSGAPPS